MKLAEVRRTAVAMPLNDPAYPLGPYKIPEQAKELGISEEDVIKHVMLKDTVDGEFTTTEGVAEAVLFFAGFKTNALTGQSLVVSHGWFME
jgi:3-hydroxybutyrate dehydrogenase